MDHLGHITYGINIHFFLRFSCFADNGRGFRFTPMMSVLIGVVSALLIVALVVILVLRLQCTRNDGRRKRNKNTNVNGGSSEHRGSISGPTLSDKGGKYNKIKYVVCKRRLQ